jgi:hypothetical protein
MDATFAARFHCQIFLKNDGDHDGKLTVTDLVRFALLPTKESAALVRPFFLTLLFSLSWSLSLPLLCQHRISSLLLQTSIQQSLAPDQPNAKQDVAATVNALDKDKDGAVSCFVQARRSLWLT